MNAALSFGCVLCHPFPRETPLCAHPSLEPMEQPYENHGALSLLCPQLRVQMISRDGLQEPGGLKDTGAGEGVASLTQA